MGKSQGNVLITIVKFLQRMSINSVTPPMILIDKELKIKDFNLINLIYY